MALPIGSIVVPLCGLYLGSYKGIIIQNGTTMETIGNHEHAVVEVF